MKNAVPTVAIIGRRNVGKSTLFNTLVEEPKAMVSSIAGTTRDRNAALVTWRGRAWQLVDTGGMEDNPSGVIDTAVRRHAERAAEDADLLCFVVDGTTGLTQEDWSVARWVRATKKPVIVVVNKLDAPRQRQQIAPEIAKLGFPLSAYLSAKNGTGTGDLLDHIAELLPSQQQTKNDEEIRLVIIGKPNVGKSSLLNCILKEERAIVSPIPHTTRDTQDSLFLFEGQRIRIIDTAGIRRRAKLARMVRRETDARLEQLSVKQTLRSIERADVAAVVLNIAEPLTGQDRHLMQIAEDARIGLLIVANQWDRIPMKTTTSINDIERQIRGFFPFLAWAPIVFVSATTGQRVYDILRAVQKIVAARQQQIPRSALDRFVKAVVAKRKPTQGRGIKPPRLGSLEQIGIAPPSFRLMIGPRQHLPTAYQRFMIQELRAKFGFWGTPISLTIENQLRT